MRSTYCQGWLMYMRYTQGQNEEYLLSGLVYVHEVYTGTERVILECTSSLERVPDYRGFGLERICCIFSIAFTCS